MDGLIEMMELAKRLDAPLSMLCLWFLLEVRKDVKHLRGRVRAVEHRQDDHERAKRASVGVVLLLLSVLSLCGCTWGERHDQTKTDETTVTTESGTDAATGHAYSRRIVVEHRAVMASDVRFETAVAPGLVDLLVGTLTGNAGGIVASLVGGLVASVAHRKITAPKKPQPALAGH